MDTTFNIGGFTTGFQHFVAFILAKCYMGKHCVVGGGVKRPKSCVHTCPLTSAKNS